MNTSSKNEEKLFDASDKKIVRFGLSRRKHLPCIWVGRICNFSPLRLDVFFKLRGVKCTKTDKGNIKVSKNGFTFTLAPKYATVFVGEFADWDRHYKPAFSLKGKTVIDVGAGCGETILYYALKGCRNFVAIEPNAECAALIKSNAESNGLKVKVYNDLFQKNHLAEQFDFMKCDCEGGEAILLEQEIGKPIALEVHGKQLMEKFAEKKFRLVRDFGNNSCIMRNY
jgi:hypothetical protein